MTHVEDLRPWLELRAIPGVGDAAYCRLVAAFGSPDAVLKAGHRELLSRGKVSPRMASAIERGPDALAKKAVEAELAELTRPDISVLTVLDTEYPDRLRAIHDPPPVLYVTGTLTPQDVHAVAIVGSRRATTAGRVFTEQLSRALAAMGFTIVSGLARGIDAAAHRGALAANGRTVAVLGCGIDRTYPPEHKNLRSQIESSGAVIAELPIGACPHGSHFPRRNRLISGMCLGVVVTEAAPESGSLITARLAADQGREVFAVPGFVKTETSRGTNGLIKQGARLVEGPDDIVSEMWPQLDAAFRNRLAPRAAVVHPAPLDGNETMLYGLLTWEGTHIDDLIETSGLAPADISGLLLSLELKGLLRQLPGQTYVRIR
jgi:DNA processing protein